MDRQGIDLRRQGWYGLKAPVKRFLSWRVPHLVLRQVARMVPPRDGIGRLPAPARLREVEGRVRDLRFVMLNPARCEIAKELYWGGGRRPRPEDALAMEVFAALAPRADVVLDVGAYRACSPSSRRRRTPRRRSTPSRSSPRSTRRSWTTWSATTSCPG